jgi:Putative auto-transporter adhesin, head GIN domain
MKRFSITLLLLAFVLALHAQNREKRSVSNFTKISFRTPGKLYLKQGSTNSVELVGDSEVLEKIEARVEDGKLIIGQEKDGSWFNWNWRDWDDDEKITAYVVIKEIEGLYVSGSGDLIAETKLTGGDMELKVSGSGNLTAEIDAQDVDVNVSGSGDLYLKGRMRSMDSGISGSGKIVFDGAVAQTVEANISGSGRFEAIGSATEIRSTISGSGRIAAADLVVDRCNVRISGSGSVQINVKTSLDATISGSGSVSYKGSPSQVNSHASGSGRVRKIS